MRARLKVVAPSLPHDFAERLAAARQDAGLKQDQLAEQLGIHWRTYQGWEAGRVPRDLSGVRRAEQILGADLTTERAAQATPGYDVASDAQLISELAGRLADRDRTISELRRQLADARADEAPQNGTVLTPDRWAARRREPDSEQR